MVGGGDKARMIRTVTIPPQPSLPGKPHKPIDRQLANLYSPVHQVSSTALPYLPVRFPVPLPARRALAEESLFTR